MTRTQRHTPDRPAWSCRACTEPWPCATAKADLLAEFQAAPSALTVYLAAQMYDALADLHGPDQPRPPDWHDRFLAWARSRR
ncbi:hypothetical protein EV385_1001 [Krasilnikovia cinnamomea]|uniref:Flavin reductase n=2 Tax=Krasilnikovia cinnamomea TaxID=349313 RepID=A0A4Q7ZGS7_9ACTN|nr:hypothetical protein EV385_1001 [Krasilnikovia cinnamomea]